MRQPGYMQPAKDRMKFMLATQRASCHNCVHSRAVQATGAPGDQHPLRCNLAHFGVTPMSTCGEHQFPPRPQPAAGPVAGPMT